MSKISLKNLTNVANECGLEILSVLSSFEENTTDINSLKRWQSEGLNADMEYMKYKAEKYLDIKNLLPEAKSVLVFSIKYSSKKVGERPLGTGRVARYAWGKDYHKVLKKRLKSFMDLYKNKHNKEPKFRIFSDAVPLLERTLAKKAGLGFIGKNTMLIKPGVGSFFFLAEIIWDQEIENPKLTLIEQDCGTCKRCIDKCPTDAFLNEYVLDAGKCISYLTIEKRDSLEIHERKKLGEWLFGCDVCQEVCPFNHRALKEDLEPDFQDFDSRHGAGPFLDLNRIMHIKNHDEFTKLFAGTPIMRTKREGLIRNAICVSVNTKYFDALPSLENLFLNEKSTMIRQHALWGILKMTNLEGNSKKYAKFIELGRKDKEETIRNEVKLERS